jgi:hypothetical protein
MTDRISPVYSKLLALLTYESKLDAPWAAHTHWFRSMGSWVNQQRREGKSGDHNHLTMLNFRQNQTSVFQHK